MRTLRLPVAECNGIPLGCRASSRPAVLIRSNEKFHTSSIDMHLGRIVSASGESYNAESRCHAGVVALVRVAWVSQLTLTRPAQRVRLPAAECMVMVIVVMVLLINIVPCAVFLARLDLGCVARVSNLHRWPAAAVQALPSLASAGSRACCGLK